MSYIFSVFLFIVIAAVLMHWGQKSPIKEPDNEETLMFVMKMVGLMFLVVLVVWLLSLLNFTGPELIITSIFFLAFMFLTHVLA